MAKKKSSASQTTALLYIVIGALFIIFQGEMLNWIMTGIGVLLIANGTLDMKKDRDLSGVLSIATGTAIIIFGLGLTSLVLTVFGILLAAKGLIDLASAAKTKKIIPILCAIVTVAAGVLLVLKKWVIVDWFFLALGILLVVNGVISLFQKQ